MAKLKEIAKESKINEIKIKYQGEVFHFNLNEELSITPAKINAELKEQPSQYGFLLLLRNRLLTVKEDLEREANKAYAHIYLKTSETKNPATGRMYSDKVAKEKATASKKYNEALNKAIKAKQNYLDIDSCIKGFEQRATLIQSLSANLRNENK